MPLSKAGRVIRVLMLDDNEDDYRITRKQLAEIRRERYELDWTSDNDDALTAMANNSYDVYIIDYLLGPKTGLDVLREAIDKGCVKPVIILTGVEDWVVDNNVMEAGAADYLVKGEITPEVLERSIRYSIQQARMAQRLYHMAHHDQLTGLANRALFWDRLEHLLKVARRTKQIVGVAYLDLDGFKRVNDEMGHNAGDELLKIVADRLVESMRDSDTISRFGGDEFVVLIENMPERSHSQIVGKKIVDVIKQPIVIDGSQADVSASVGIALYPDGGQSADDLIKNADTAMYEAKNGGKNQFRIFDQPLAAE
ncbi:MAG: diguanylate cyclase [Rhodospirillales bacterium]